MKTESKARITASVATALIAAVAYVLMSLLYLSVSANRPPTSPKGDITIIEEEFVEVLPPATTTTAHDEDAASYLDEPVETDSQPTPPAGTDLDNSGPKNDAPNVVASKEPSPVKVTKKDEAVTGPPVDKKKEKEERVRREASDEVANAFRNSSGKHNTSTTDKDTDNSGNKTKSKNTQGTTGSGAGSVGGGWIIPKYAPVRSTVTGTIKMTVKIDETGRVVSVEFTGGTPPAATDKAVQAAVEREIRAHKFSRGSYDDAQPATAYVTYIFK